MTRPAEARPTAGAGVIAADRAAREAGEELLAGVVAATVPALAAAGWDIRARPMLSADRANQLHMYLVAGREVRLAVTTTYPTRAFTDYRELLRAAVDSPDRAVAYLRAGGFIPEPSAQPPKPAALEAVR